MHQGTAVEDWSPSLMGCRRSGRRTIVVAVAAVVVVVVVVVFVVVEVADFAGFVVDIVDFDIVVVGFVVGFVDLGSYCY